MKDHCPHCSEEGFFNGVSCSSCGYGRGRNSGVITAQERKRDILRKQQEEKKLLALVAEMREHPVTKKFDHARMWKIAELCVLFNMSSLQEWLSKGPYVQHQTGISPEIARQLKNSHG